jgi:hypothetical protein
MAFTSRGRTQHMAFTYKLPRDRAQSEAWPCRDGWFRDGLGSKVLINVESEASRPRVSRGVRADVDRGDVRIAGSHLGRTFPANLRGADATSGLDKIAVRFSSNASDGPACPGSRAPSPPSQLGTSRRLSRRVRRLVALALTCRAGREQSGAGCAPPCAALSEPRGIVSACW